MQQLLSFSFTFGQLRRKYEELYLTNAQAWVLSFSLMIFLLLLGIVALRTIDYYRGRAKKFLPLFDVIDDAYQGMRQSFLIPFIMGGIGALTFSVNWGITIFFGLVVLMLISDRVDLERRSRFVANVCAELSEAMRCGIALDKFFDTIVKNYYASKSFRNVGAQLRTGMSLSEALEKTQVFPAYALLAIRAGETGGGSSLAKTLQNLSISLRNETRVSANLLTITLIPILGWTLATVLCLGISSGRILDLLYLVRYGPAYSGFRTFSQLLNFTGCISFIVMGLVLILFSYEKILISGKMFLFINRILYRLPIIGRRRHHRDLSRICHALDAMTNSKVPLWTAFRLVAQDELSGIYAPSLRLVADNLEKGVPMYEAIKTSDLPDSVTCLLISGAKGGVLADALAAAAEWHDSRALKLDRILLAMVPCVLIPMAGCIIGFVFGSLFWVLMEMRERVTPHSGLGL
jgi:type II secretory pathway component PulF